MKEAELLFSELFGCDRASLYLNKGLRLGREKSSFVSAVLKRRSLGEPLQYILGKSEFMGLEFKVGPDVLIPRPETEILVEKTVSLLSGLPVSPSRILDLGAGSGNIAISLAQFFPQAKIDAVDVSEEALEVARANAVLNKVKVNFMQSDLFSVFNTIPGTQYPIHRPYDVIVSNPPYIKSDEIDKLQIEVRREPRIALDGGKDGLDFYRRIINDAARYLRKQGLLVLEIGYKQLTGVKNIFQKSARFEIIEAVKDYNNIDRVIAAKKRS